MRPKDKLKSRKLWLTIATIVFALAGWFTGNIEPLEALKIILTAAGVYTGAEALVDLTNSKK